MCLTFFVDCHSCNLDFVSLHFLLMPIFLVYQEPRTLSFSLSLSSDVELWYLWGPARFNHDLRARFGRSTCRAQVVESPKANYYDDDDDDAEGYLLFSLARWWLLFFFSPDIPKQAGAARQNSFLFRPPWSRSSARSALLKSRDTLSPCNRGGSLITGASGVYRWLTRR